MSSCLATTRHTLSPCLVLRNMATSSSWERPVMSTPFTWTHVCTWFQWISYANSQWVFPFKVVTYYYTRNILKKNLTLERDSLLVSCHLTAGGHLWQQLLSVRCFWRGWGRARALKNLWSQRWSPDLQDLWGDWESLKWLTDETQFVSNNALIRVWSLFSPQSARLCQQGVCEIAQLHVILEVSYGYINNR